LDRDFNLLYFDDAVPTMIGRLHEFVCPQCGFVLGAVDVLSAHVKSHGRQACMICWQTGRFLPADIPIFPKAQYHTHLGQQHPRCCCCDFRAFDPTQLAEHMNANHFRCQICPTVRWFRVAHDLIEHNQREHFVCHHEECSSEHLIAFATRGELFLHLQSEHREREGEGISLSDFVEPVNRAEDEAAQVKARRRELNRRFMAKLNQVFEKDPQITVSLQAEAQRFLQGRTSPEEFYERFSEICGPAKAQIFTDMVAILPDPIKRGALLKIHETGPRPPKEVRPAPALPRPMSEPARPRQSEPVPPPLSEPVSPRQSELGPPPPRPPPPRPKSKKTKKIIITHW
jgi:hypothetical protein